MSLTLAEARARAACLSDVAYDIDLDLTDHRGETFGSTTTMRFTTSQPTTFVELSDARDLRVSVDGHPVEAAYDGRRVQLEDLPTGRPVQVRVSARVPYVSDGDGMHRMSDPVDGETYVSAYLSLDIAQRVFACFDQPDVKATLDVAVSADPRWSVLGNGRVVERDGGRWVFATTPRLCPSLFVVCAGPWHSVTWEHAGLPFGWHARASLAAELDRDAEELVRTTNACFDHYATLFEEPYPFDSYDQLFGPGHNWGAMETPGCVTYRDELLPRGRVTDDQRSRRASIIAHEMAHMWFGNLVTMRWWEDTWLNEIFADYMGYRVAADGAGFPGPVVVRDRPASPRLRRRRAALDAPGGPRAHRRAGRGHGVRQLRHDLLRQGQLLPAPAGDLAGRRGLPARRQHAPDRHRFGNATWRLGRRTGDAVTDRDVRGWAQAWLRAHRLRHPRACAATTTASRCWSRGVASAPLLRRGLRRRGRLVGPAGRPRRRAGRARGVAGAGVVPNSRRRDLRAAPARRALRGRRDRHLGVVEDELVRAVLWWPAFDLVRSRRSRRRAPSSTSSQRHLPREPHPAWSRGRARRGRSAPC